MSSDATEWRQIRLRTGDVLSILDIGQGGAMVESSRRLLPGAVLAVSLIASDRTLTLEVRVRRCTVRTIERTAGIRYCGALEFLRWPAASEAPGDSRDVQTSPPAALQEK